MASKVRWKVLSITGFVSAMVPSKSRITIFFILLVFYSYVLLFIVLHYLFIGSYGIWSDGSYERRRHSIGLVLIHDTHHDVNVEL